MLERKKQSSRSLVAGTVLLLVAGGGLGYWFYTQRAAGPEDLPTGANVIPQSALMTLSFSTDTEKWQTLRGFGTPESQALFDRNLAQLRDRLLTANGLNYTQDIQPWIGEEVTVAFLSPESAAPGSSATPTPTPSQRQPTLLVVPIANPLKAKQLLDNPNVFKGVKWVERNYNGVQVRETQPGSPRAYATAVLDQRLLVLSSDARATERAIDTFKGQPALTATPGYSQAAGRIQAAQPFGKIYVNLPVAAATAAANSARPTPAPATVAQDNQGLAATLTLEPAGVQFKGISWLKPNSQTKHSVQNTAKTMPTLLPSNTLIMASGANLQNLWQQYQLGADSNPMTTLNPQTLRAGIQSTTGLDLDKDLLPWMSGEFSLSLLPAPQGSATNLPAGLVFMVKTSDRRGAETALKQLDEAMTRRYRFKVDQTQISNQPVVNWTLPFGGTLASHGWLPGDVAFLTVGAPVVSTIVPQPSAALGESELFRKAVPANGNSNHGYFFMNVDQALSTNLGLLPLSPNAKTLLSGVQTIGMVTTVQDERSIKYNLLVTLKQGNKPGPLPSPSVSSRN